MVVRRDSTMATWDSLFEPFSILHVPANPKSARWVEAAGTDLQAAHLHPGTIFDKARASLKRPQEWLASLLERVGRGGP